MLGDPTIHSQIRMFLMNFENNAKGPRKTELLADATRDVIVNFYKELIGKIIQFAKSMIDEQGVQLKDAKAKLTTYQNEIIEKDLQLDAALKEKEQMNLHKSLDIMRATSQIQENLQEVTAKVSQFKEKCDKKKEKIRTLKKDIAALKEQNSKFEYENERLRKKMQSTSSTTLSASLEVPSPRILAESLVDSRLVKDLKDELERARREHEQTKSRLTEQNKNLLTQLEHFEERFKEMSLRNSSINSFLVSEIRPSEVESESQKKVIEKLAQENKMLQEVLLSQKKAMEEQYQTLEKRESDLAEFKGSSQRVESFKADFYRFFLHLMDKVKRKTKKDVKDQYIWEFLENCDQDIARAIRDGLHNRGVTILPEKKPRQRFMNNIISSSAPSIELSQLTFVLLVLSLIHI
eukprot:TRINITY_DN5019_c0_g1_i5.p1 TRINITY_DN5019_c0_g1~~TRINITY_DN5019_c0_g1_i5.p1  ORF type:complete len:407 (+),score=60.04 TRINITY_DN5019_c0_g1_i5:183-1403(+)